MKKITIALIVLLVAAWVASAAEISLRQIRDPVQFKDWIATNISDVSGVATNIAGASIVSGNIDVARITNAASTVGASIGGNIPLAAVTNALRTAVIPVAGISNAVVSTYLPASSVGRFNVVGTTQLVFIANSVTNVIDADITSP